MSEIIQFPVSSDRHDSDRDAAINEELKSVPQRDREKLRFELIKMLDTYDGFFTKWSLSLPENADDTLKKQIYDIAHQEHERKMRMLRDIMILKIKVLVAEYHRRN